MTTSPIRAATVLLALALAACAQDQHASDAVPDEATAIAVARAACPEIAAASPDAGWIALYHYGDWYVSTDEENMPSPIKVHAANGLTACENWIIVG